MKTRFFAAGVALAIGATGAFAADMQRPAYYSPAPAAGPAAFSWVGPYAGLNFGYEWGGVTRSPNDPSGIFGGGQLGYNWQSGQVVYGVETDLQISGADDTAAGVEFSNLWWGSTRGRIGYAWNSFLFYGTAGLAYGGLKADNGVSEDKTLWGWTAGGGVEVGLNRAWSAKAEYLYVDLDNRNYTITGAKNGFWSNMLRLGVNYHF